MKILQALFIVSTITMLPAFASEQSTLDAEESSISNEESAQQELEQIEIEQIEREKELNKDLKPLPKQTWKAWLWSQCTGQNFDLVLSILFVASMGYLILNSKDTPAPKPLLCESCGLNPDRAYYTAAQCRSLFCPKKFIPSKFKPF